MFANKSEAFAYNSCKKVAQLAKVVTQLKESHFERKRIYFSLINVFEKEIQRLFDQYVDELNKINNELTRSRKNTVDSACRNFGNKYKKAKTDFTLAVKDTASNFSKIVSNAKTLKHECLLIESEITKNANSVTRSAEAFYKETKKLQSRKSINEMIDNNPTIKDMVMKITNHMQQSLNNVQEMKQNYGEEMNSLSLKINNSLKDEMQNRAPLFVTMKERAKTIETENNKIKKFVTNGLTQAIETNKANKQKQDLLISKTNAEITEINSQKNKAKQQLENEKNSQRKLLVSVRKQMKELSKTNSLEIDAINGQIKVNQDEIKELEEAYENNRKKTDEINEEIRKTMTEKFEKTKETFVNYGNLIDEYNQRYQTEINKIKEELAENSSNSLEILNKKKENYQNNMKKSQNNVNECLKLDKNNFNNEIEEWNKKVTDKYEQFIKETNEVVKKARESFELIIKDKESLMKEQEKEIEDKNKQSEVLSIEQQSKYDELKESRKEMINYSYENKRKDLQRKRESVLQHFDSDIKMKSEEISELHKIALNEKKKEFEEAITNESYEKQHKEEINKAMNILKLIAIDIENLKKERENKVETLSNQISNQEKAIRTLQRGVKTETQSIISDFELKIQVEQVSLKEKVENISALFNKEENQRGSEIIDAVRKIRQVKNRTEDLINKHTKELNEMKRKHMKTENHIKELIAQIKDGTHEKNLNESLSKMRENELNEIKKKDEEFNFAEEKIRNEIIKEQKLFEAEKNEIKDKIEKDAKEFDEAVKEHVMKMKEIEASVLKKREEIKTETEKKKKEIEKNNSNEKQKIKTRILSLSSAQLELKHTIDTGIKESIEAKNNEINEREHEKDSQIKSLLLSTNQQNEKQDKIIREQYKAQTSKILESYDHKERRQQEDDKIKETKSRADDLKKEIVNLTEKVLQIFSPEFSDNVMKASNAEESKIPSTSRKEKKVIKKKKHSGNARPSTSYSQRPSRARKDNLL